MAEESNLQIEFPRNRAFSLIIPTIEVSIYNNFRTQYYRLLEPVRTNLRIVCILCLNTIFLKY